MPRCNCDGVLYRIFCITLLSIAVLSTIVLINVVIDIDGMLSDKTVKIKPTEKVFNEQDDMEAVFVQDYKTDANQGSYSYEEDHEDTDDYRTKRSLESPNNYLNKKTLKNRLETLLEELDQQEAKIEKKAQPYVKFSSEKNSKEDTKANEVTIIEKQYKKEDDMLHTAVHNILLEGMAQNTNIYDVYRRIHLLLDSLEELKHAQKGSLAHNFGQIEEDMQKSNLRKHLFSEELINCKTLQEDISRVTEEKNSRRSSKNGPRLVISTVIDILSPTIADYKEDKTLNGDNFKGIMKLIYNSTPAKIQNKEGNDPTKYILEKVNSNDTKKMSNPKDQYEILPKTVIDKILEEYYKNDGKEDKSITVINNKQKRMKRHIKIRYETNDSTTETPNTKKPKKDDDELFVEIETHFDGKGLKGDKKKKLIKNLIDKIQKAISNETYHEVDKKKKHNHLHVKKREQSPLDHKSQAILINKLAVPFERFTHRVINPINKAMPLTEPLPLVDNMSGETWRQRYTQPHFLSPTKAINSAELSQVDADYNRVLEINGIPQRLQKPINTEASEEIPSTYFDLGKLKFYVKDIDGSGFAVGFNQYEDAAPDMETMKLFTGLENLLQNYHETYDVNQPVPASYERVIPELEMIKPEHILTKRSAAKEDYHYNEHKLLFDGNYMPFDDYKDIFDNKHHRNKIYQKNKQIPLVLDQNIFNKRLKPAEIFTLADLFRKKRSTQHFKNDNLKTIINLKKILKRTQIREKRSLSLKKFSNLKSKIKLNRFLNTKPRATKKIFMNKKRNKRQVGKIRIIATDIQNDQRSSDEDILFFSDEKIFADRAIVRDISNRETTLPATEQVQEPVEPEKELSYDYITPYVYQQPLYQQMYSKQVQNNALMSKYPHILLEEIQGSKEFELPYDMIKVHESNTPQELPEINQNQVHEATVNTTLSPIEMQDRVGDIVNAIAPKSNYKLTVKLIPKNSTDVNSGYKEIHTIINNSFNKDGLQYSSLVNVSEISKIVKLNKTNSTPKPVKDVTQSPILRNMIETHNKMKYLLEQHKDRINSQLEQLNKEKEKLELILVNNETDFDQFTSPNFSLDIPQQVPNLINVVENKIPITTITSPPKPFEIQTTMTEAPNFPATTTVDPARALLMNSVERNENLTSEILRKIDKNTDLLQTFLQKVIKSIEVTTEASKPTKINLTTPVKDTKNNNPEAIFNHYLSNPRDIISPSDFFAKTVPSLEGVKNKTHISIPFVYAYQHPNNLEEPVSSVIYHGHIHTDTIPGKKQKENEKVFNNAVKREVNETRFFIDELEAEYKVIPLEKKSATYPNNNSLGVILNNGTV